MASPPSLSLLVYAGCALVLALACALLSRLLRFQPSRVPAPEQDTASPAPTESRGRHFDVPFFRLIAVAAIMQAALVLLFAWAVPLRQLVVERSPGLIGLLLFVAVMASGFIYAWSKGGFDWDPRGRDRGEE